MNKIFGVREMSVHMGMDEATTINLELVASPGYNAQFLYDEKYWDEKFPGDVVVKCQFCGQWGARKCSCIHCGGAIE